MFKWDILIINAKLATMSDGANSYGMIENGAIAITNEEIQWVGSSSSLNKIPNELAKEVIDAQRNLVTPGLIDCHTHLVFAGNRSDEFEQRLNGISYEEIAKQGGGILSTVRATREASFDELYQQSLPRFQALMNEE